MKKLLWLITLLIFLITGCSEKKDTGLSVVDSLKIELKKEIDSLQRAAEQKPVIYSLYKKMINKENLLNDFGDDGFRIILALNRVDASHLRNADTLVVPDKIVNEFRTYSPFPFEIPEAYEVEKLLIISQTIQAFAAYEFGNLVKWGPTSTGKRSTPTPNGLFHTNWKSKEIISTIDEEWLLKWNFNIENFEGISLHQYDMPGYPASHACARLYAEDAEWHYYWSQQWIVTPDGESVVAYGTPIILFGEYDYKNPRVWRRLADNPEKAVITREDISELMDEYLYLILKRQEYRKLIMARRDSLKTSNEEAALK